MAIDRVAARSMRSRKRTGCGATPTLLTPICRNISTRSRTRTSSNRWPGASPACAWLIKLWLQAPAEERDGDGKRRMSGGRSSKRGHAAGRSRQSAALCHLHESLSQVLASQRTWRSIPCACHLLCGSYADDFVILSRGHANEALAWTRAVMTKLGLTLNERTLGGKPSISLAIRSDHATSPTVVVGIWARRRPRKACSGSRRKSATC
jgi:hypothetical protein